MKKIVILLQLIFFISSTCFASFPRDYSTMVAQQIIQSKIEEEERSLLNKNFPELDLITEKLLKELEDNRSSLNAANIENEIILFQKNEKTLDEMMHSVSKIIVQSISNYNSSLQKADVKDYRTHASKGSKEQEMAQLQLYKVFSLLTDPGLYEAQVINQSKNEIHSYLQKENRDDQKRIDLEQLAPLISLLMVAPFVLLFHDKIHDPNNEISALYMAMFSPLVYFKALKMVRNFKVRRLRNEVKSFEEGKDQEKISSFKSEMRSKFLRIFQKELEIADIDFSNSNLEKLLGINFCEQELVKKHPIKVRIENSSSAQKLEQLQDEEFNSEEENYTQVSKKLQQQRQK